MPTAATPETPLGLYDVPPIWGHVLDYLPRATMDVALSAVVDDGEAAAGKLGRDLQDLPTGDARADGAAVEHPRKTQIVHVLRHAQDLVPTIQARRTLTCDPLGFVG